MTVESALLPMAESSVQAPVIYFDGHTTGGFSGGVANITLAVRVFEAMNDGSNITKVVACAHLRTSLAGLLDLQTAVNNAVLAAMPTQGDGEPN